MEHFCFRSWGVHLLKYEWPIICFLETSIIEKKRYNKMNFNCRTWTFTYKLHNISLRFLTSANIAIVRFKSSFTCAAANRNHPLSITIAVEFYWDIHFLWVGDAISSCNDKWGTLRPCHGLWKDCKVLDHAWAFFVKHPYRQKRHAGSVVLKSKVEAILGQWTKASYFCIDLH